MNGSRNKIHAIRHKVILIHHGGGALVALSVARGEKSVPGERRVSRIDARTRCRVVEAGRESSFANEVGGPGKLMDGDCWKGCLLYGDTHEQHLCNFILRSDGDHEGASFHTTSTRTTYSSSSSCFTSPDDRSSTGKSTILLQLNFGKTLQVSLM